MNTLTDLADLVRLESFSAESSLAVDRAIESACASFSEHDHAGFISALADIRQHAFALGVAYSQKAALGLVHLD